MQVGDSVSWMVPGRGRGGHVRAYGVITQVNSKTVDVTERAGSYKPGTLWRVLKEDVRVDTRPL
jgi:hypothetical protein